MSLTTILPIYVKSLTSSYRLSLKTPPNTITMTIADDINTISTFVSHNQIQLNASSQPQHFDTIILCVSAIFHCATTVFSALRTHGADLSPTLVLCGGIGHSTPHLYSAVAKHPRYAHLAPEIKGLPEAQVMRVILENCFDGDKVREMGVKVLIEDRSTNCGANALETKTLLQKHGIGIGGTALVVQDPTMSLRTLKSFEQAFEGEGVLFSACPTFVPRVEEVEGVLRFDEVAGVKAEGLWDMDRFLGLLLGEVLRLRDDEAGYGPRGKGFIGHVDVPEEVEEAYRRLEKVVEANR